MDNSHLISVIVPAYNVEHYIERTINSILKQTYKNIEIVIVNDGSTDSTGKIIDEFASEYPKQVKAFHIPNAGVTNARLYGVAHSKGEWIGFVDSDDVAEKDMYEFLINNAIKYEADISHCGYKMIFQDGREHYFHNTNVLLCHDTNEALRELLSGSIIEPGLWNKLFKRSIFDDFYKSEKMDYSIKINEDLLMNFILFSYSKKSVFNDVCKYEYLVRSGSASRTSLSYNKVFDPIKVKELIINYAPELVKNDANKSYIGTCVNVYNSIVMSKNTEFRHELKNLRKRIKDKRDKLCLLNKKTKLLVSIILWMPWAYKAMYSIYSRLFQVKKYE